MFVIDHAQNPMWRGLESPPPKHFSDANVIALRTALDDRVPFYSGTCALPYYQRFLYYADGERLSRIDFSEATSYDLDALYRACKPAEFGRGSENVFDESYRKAGKMDLASFSTLLDPRRLGIHEQVSKSLLIGTHATMESELYKLNVYGKGDFFKAHKDTPRSQNMFGSMVIVFPTPHEGGQLVLRQAEKEWTFDFADMLATATKPSVCFLAFYGDVEHAVLPVTSGYRVTLTYNLYHESIYPGSLSISNPYQLKVKQTLANLVNDESVLTNGGYLGFGLVHEYVQKGRNVIEPLLGQLKGADRALADACDVLGLNYSLRLLYRDIANSYLHLITTAELNLEVRAADSNEPTYHLYLEHALEELTIDEAEVITFVGRLQPGEDELDCQDILQQHCRDPITEVLEVTPMQSSINLTSPICTYGNEMVLEYIYGTACMLVAVGPAESRCSSSP